MNQQNKPENISDLTPEQVVSIFTSNRTNIFLNGWLIEIIVAIQKEIMGEPSVKEQT